MCEVKEEKTNRRRLVNELRNIELVYGKDCEMYHLLY
jgi:hypothetical protein